ncbi:uncharacterized protein Z518_00663 [Rhinocladiella mackenziei CBS 650.93]|uniref:Uncharacterized protein n=1 Tax=Rhinocladiella mackenziei CBS 650.93 TaxID=1442369 RepID=A0A0D2HG20_9EURO|nr:uncharacterized protein Z518_00663 [Rhinocladiella mackenziei CBS 650.93]KIX09583.1 hypothetical protein Z518_00663 [Rhinocladiella mackenziei CBS 650.93]
MFGPTIIILLGVVLILLVTPKSGRIIRRWLVAGLSYMIHQILLRVYPVYHEDGKTQIPTVPYQWPDGQGDVGKFLDGIENSSAWEKANGRVYRIWSGMTPEIVLASPDHLRIVFQDSAKHVKAANNNSGWLMNQVLGECVGLVSNKKWRCLRAATEAPFTHSAVTAYVDRVRRRIEEYMTSLETHGQLRCGILDPAGDMKMLPFLVVAEIIYGGISSEMEEELRGLAPLREELFRYIIKGGLPRYSWSRFLPTRANQALSVFKVAWASFNDRAVQRARDLSLGAPIEQMYAAVTAGTITADQLYQTLDESLYANLDVTTGALSWNLVFLASSPGTQQRVRQEVETFCRTGTMHKYLLDSSTYLTACILESSRLKPLAAFSVPQAAPTERVIDGYIVPGGTNFVVDSYAINIRHEFWGPDRTQYRPDRFLQLAAKDLRYHFWRFGFGSRQCMGKFVADLMLRALLTHMVTHFDTCLLDDEAEWRRDTESWITHPKMKLRCTKRTQNEGRI